MNDHKKQSMGVLIAVLGVAITMYLLGGTPQSSTQVQTPVTRVVTVAPTITLFPSPGPTNASNMSAVTTVPQPTTPPPATRTFTQSSSYDTPQGTETITVNLTLAGDVIQSVSDTHSALGGGNGNGFMGMMGGGGGTSSIYQRAFENEIANQVVGKKITDLNLYAVAGSSLTTGGFMDAIGKIKSMM